MLAEFELHVCGTERPSHPLRRALIAIHLHSVNTWSWKESLFCSHVIFWSTTEWIISSDNGVILWCVLYMLYKTNKRIGLWIVSINIQVIHNIITSGYGLSAEARAGNQQSNNIAWPWENAPHMHTTLAAFPSNGVAYFPIEQYR